MRSDHPDRDEIVANFEAALAAALRGCGPSTVQGFDGKTTDALMKLAAAAHEVHDNLLPAARAEFARQLDGTNAREDAEKLIEELMTSHKTVSPISPADSSTESAVASDGVTPTGDHEAPEYPKFPAPPEIVYRSDWRVPFHGDGTEVYEGDGPIDPGSGNFHILTIWAKETEDYFDIHLHDDGRGWAKDLGKLYRIDDPDELIKLRQALRATWGELVQSFADRIKDGEIMVPGRRDHWMDIVNFPSAWLDEHNIKYHWAQRISED